MLLFPKFYFTVFSLSVPVILAALLVRKITISNKIEEISLAVTKSEES